jgi:hypothetical protein
MILSELSVDVADLEKRTGWAIKPEGACKAEVCVPLPPDADIGSGKVDVGVLAERLTMPLVRDEASSLWAMGPESGISGRALTTARVPEIVLPDLDGNELALSSLKGQKVLLVAWASW